MMFFDRNGKPVELLEWAELMQDVEYIQVAFFEDERIQISTVWRGIDTLIPESARRSFSRR